MNPTNPTGAWTPPTDDAPRAPEREVERILGDLEGIGRDWARHGLRVGASALETSATTLRRTSETLARLAARLGDAPAADTAPAAEATAPPPAAAAPADRARP